MEEFLDEIHKLNEPEEFERALTDTISGLGFDYFTYINMRLASGYRGSPLVFRSIPYCITTFTQEWRDYYHDQECHNYDPVLRAGVSSVLPAKWSDISSDIEIGRRSRQVMSVAEDFRLRHGLSIPVHGPAGEFGLVNVVSGESEREFRHLTESFKHQLHIMAIHYHSAVQRVLTKDKEYQGPVKLTPRETECLLWTAQGKTAWDISAILSISERSVNFHISNAKKRLNVYSKTHAVAKLLSMGVLHI